MTKRSLPQRTTRGQLPEYLRDLPSPPKRDFKLSEPNPLQVQRKELEYRLKAQQLINLQKYPFNRAVHYFFNLDQFPRAVGHVSYAIDTNNSLKNTFSKDKNQLNIYSYGEVLNRQFFGLPISIRDNILLKQQNRCKNVCYIHLSEIQDKKYQNDRMICLLKVILKKMAKKDSLLQFHNCELLRKDCELEMVLNQNQPLQERIQIVKNRLQFLREKKRIKNATWEIEDKLYFYHSLNQKLHNTINDLKQRLNFQHLIKIIYEIEPISKTLKNCLFNLHYYYNNSKALSSSACLRAMPVSFFFEGSLKMLKLAGQIIAKRTESLGETSYYEAKDMVKNLFKFQLSLRPSKINNLTAFQTKFRRCCEQIKKTKISVKGQIQEIKLLDEFVKDKQLVLGSRNDITGKQFNLMIIFFWICRGLTEISPYLDKFPELISYIANDYFPKVSNSLIQATASPLIGMMCAAIQSLSDVFSKPDIFSHLPSKVYFQFNPNIGVGLIYREDKENQTQLSARKNQGVQQQTIGPSKRIKIDSA